MFKILIVSEYKITSNIGGVGRVSATLAKGFINKGHSVYYYAFCTPQEPLMEGVPQYYCTNLLKINSPENVSQLEKLIKELGINVIINQSAFHTEILPLLFKLKEEKIALISCHHNCIKCLYDNYINIISNSFDKKRWFKILNNATGRLLLRGIYKYRLRKIILNVISKSDRFVLLSKTFINDILYFDDGFNLEKVVAISNPASFELQPQALEKKENRLLFIGIIKTNQKRVERLVQIWKEVSKEFIDWHIDIVGDGTEREMLQKMFAENGLERYHFYGFADPRPYLTKAKIFLLTSDFEGFGMVLVESQVYGVVPVAFNCFASVHEIIQHNQNGILVEPYDMKSYIQETISLMKDEERRRAIAQKGLETVQKFSLDKIISNWEQLFISIRNSKDK